MKKTENRLIDWVENGNGCWECTSHYRGEQGYVYVNRNGEATHVHRFIYEECFGELPRNIMVRHLCNNPSCINPEHLAAGTAKENTNDMRSAGTFVFGERHGSHKLTWDDVEYIKRNYVFGNSRRLAAIYGVNKSTILNIIERKTWKLIPNASAGVGYSRPRIGATEGARHD
jgi:hypothetical protein